MNMFAHHRPFARGSKMAHNAIHALATQPSTRRRTYGVAGLILAVLTLVPQPYVARAQLVPQDGSSIGLSSLVNSLGSQYQGFAALLGGGKQPIDLYLASARSQEVTGDVIRHLGLDGAREFGSERAARLALDRMVDIHSLTGGILEVETRGHDAVEAERLTQAYVAAITARLNALAADRVARKRALVAKRFNEAALRVAKAESDLTAFRRDRNLAAPEVQLGAALSLRAGLQAQLQAKRVELETLQRFQGPDNPQIQAVQTQIGSIEGQIASSATPAESKAGPNVAGLSEVSGHYLDLYRDYRFAQALYEVYARASEEAEVEALATETASDAQVIEAPHLDPDRKLNMAPAALFVLIVLLAFCTEVYVPMTGARRPGQAEETAR